MGNSRRLQVSLDSRMLVETGHDRLPKEKGQGIGRLAAIGREDLLYLQHEARDLARCGRNRPRVGQATGFPGPMPPAMRRIASTPPSPKSSRESAWAFSQAG